MDHAEQSDTDALRVASKSAIQKTANAIGGLTVDEIADKITIVSKRSTTEHFKDGPNKTYFTGWAKNNAPKI